MPVVGQEFVITTPAEWAAVSSPARFELLEFMRMHAPCSLAELGRAMARAPDSLYHHMRVLCRIGLAVRAEDRPLSASAKSGRQGGSGKSGRTEAVFDLARRQLRFEVDPPSGRNVKAVQRLTAGLCRVTSRSMAHALEAGIPIGQGPAKQVWARAETAWLDDEALAAVNQHLLAVDAIFERGRVERRGRLFRVSFFLSPAVRHERGRRTEPRNATPGAAPKATPGTRKGSKAWIVPTA